MQYELKKLEELINIGLNPIKQNNLVTSEMLELFLNIAQSEQQRIKEKLLDSAVLLKNSTHICHYIQQHQRGVINLLDNLLDSIEQTAGIKGKTIPSAPYNLINTQKAVFLIIEDLLHFIENRYVSHCNLKLKIHNKYKIIKIKEYVKRINHLESKYGNNLPPLLEIAPYPIKKLIKNSKTTINYNGIIYYGKLLDIILNLEESIANNEIRLIKSLIYINFNSIYFAHYCIVMFKREVSKLDSIAEKTDKLGWFVKVINQCQMRTDCALFPNKVNIIEYLTQWLFEEICYLEKKMQFQGLSQQEENEMMKKNIKMITDLTVSQIACFVRLFVDIGVLKNKNKEEIYRFYATYFQSKFQENISIGSFRSKYFGINESVKSDVKDIIIKMLNELNDMKTKN